jgi:hypothetical protein
MIGWLLSILGLDEPRWSPEEKALFRKAALAEPDDNEAHLCLAALLEKNGKPLGTFIRVWIESIQAPSDSPLHQQLEELHSRHMRAWARPLERMGQEYWFAGEFMPWGSVERGLFYKFSLNNPNTLLRSPDAFFNRIPALSYLELYSSSDKSGELDEMQAKTAALFSVPQLSQITTLSIDSNWLDRRGIEALAKSANLGNLRKLVLKSCKFGDAGATKLAQSSNLTNLRSLTISNCDVTHQGIQAIARSPHFHKLESLEIQNLTLGTEPYSPHVFKEPAIGLAELYQLSKLRDLKANLYDLVPSVLETWATKADWSLRTLNLNHSNIQPEGAIQLARGHWWADMEELDLGSNNLGDDGLYAMVQGNCFRSCKSIELSNTGLGEKAITAFRGQTYPNLEKLKLVQNQIPGHALPAFFQASMPKLKELNLSTNPLRDEAVTHILAWHGLRSLEKLNLDHTEISSKQLIKLITSPQVSGLTMLGLTMNHYGPEFLDALLQSEHLSKEVTLYLNTKDIDSVMLGRLRNRFEDLR